MNDDRCPISDRPSDPKIACLELILSFAFFPTVILVARLAFYWLKC